MTKTIVEALDGSKWKPSSGSDMLPKEVQASSERRDTTILVTAPEAVRGEA